ncbi:MAG: fructose-bisphosphate aldolase class I [Candidatus Uhrbacteria bacterium]|nr:fructose-bisphosphate aldolase class I [Candidatus Uhrbacteria bacterium]
MSQRSLREIVKAMFPAGKGLLAADESTKSSSKRLDPIGVPSTPENRRRFRELYLSAPGVEQYMSGVILVDETLRQTDSLGVPFPKSLADRGIVPGIKVDGGTKDLPGFPEESMTEGLDGLADRLKEYADLGAEFAKWRAVIRIGKDIPSDACIRLNAVSLAIYALRCQEAGIVPMVEPEVLLSGSHTMEVAEQVTTRTLKTVIDTMRLFRVDLSCAVMKTSMIVPGDTSGQVASPDHVAEATARCLRATIPDEMGGVVFLSGGQTSEQATLNLNAIAKLGPYPWPVTFCYARALQYPALEIWAGKDELLPEARTAFLERLKANAAASMGHFG